MDTIDQLMKKAQKELEKVRIQTKGFLGIETSVRNRTNIEENAQSEVNQANQSLSKNASALKETVKGNFANKLTETFEKQEQTLENI